MTRRRGSDLRKANIREKFKADSASLHSFGTGAGNCRPILGNGLTPIVFASGGNPLSLSVSLLPLCFFYDETHAHSHKTLLAAYYYIMRPPPGL